ncbi:MAG: hypothetical protein IJY90_00055 [Clostridia bacterium]|nr:hypothetical protein [Clostridia bacterium]
MILDTLEQKLAEIQRRFREFSAWENKLEQIINAGDSKGLAKFARETGAPLNLENIYLLDMLSRLTLGSTGPSAERKLLEEARKDNMIKSFEMREKGVLIVMKDGKPLRMIRITDYFQGIGKSIPRLYTEERLGKSHQDCYNLSGVINLTHRVVSGYCSAESKAKQCPHTWLEIDGRRHEWVLDFTLNAMISKDAYYKIFRPRNIVKIDCFQVKEDAKMLRSAALCDKDIRLYLYHPQELRMAMMRQLSKEHDASEVGI